MQDLGKRAAVLDALLNGLSVKEIGGKMNLSDCGVKYHVSRIFRQYGVTSRKALIAKFGRFEVVVKWIPAGQNTKEERL